MKNPITNLHTLHVLPALPEKLSRLRAIATDLYWTWNHDAIDLFRRIDQKIWKSSDQNPVKLLSEVAQDRLEEISRDDGFISHLDRVWNTFEEYLNSPTWFQMTFKNHEEMLIAYFSAEVGLHECLPIYSGGLGILAGDHLKAASDLGIPLIGVSLSYQLGYFRQYLNADGWQQETYPENEFFNLPVELVRDDHGDPVECQVRVGNRDVVIHIWQVRLGRVKLYLLDTNVISNTEDDRKITENLYGGDSEMRIRQEIVLGIGGIHALDKLGIKATIYHMNEGHSAFLALERIRLFMIDYQMTFDEALQAAKAGQVFTTHTPVPAGIDRFSLNLMEKYFHHYWPTLGLNRSQFLALGGVTDETPESTFNLATMAIHLSAFVNGVSQLHAEVSKNMWRNLWPDFHKAEVPIEAITNGVHAPSWISGDMRMILNRELGPKWEENPLDSRFWTQIENISSEEIFRVRERLRGHLVVFARRKLQRQLMHRNASMHLIERAREILDMNTLTIGFARRFATYKRASLLFRDPERLRKILTDPKRPVQLIFAGKAHPQDDPGKRIIREIVHFARDEELRGRIVFLEDYEINIARHMVQGCDIWLNTPRRPYEASGTSGMKAAVNGVLNCSTLDGWWAEAYKPEIGWAIGKGESYSDLEYQDQIESEALYDLLEDEIVPTFYERDRLNVARDWTRMIKKSLVELLPVFVTTRMVDEYTRKAYIPCYERSYQLQQDNLAGARNLTSWIQRVKKAWQHVKVLEVVTEKQLQLRVGERVKVSAVVQLGDLSPDDVLVEATIGHMGGARELKDIMGIPLDYIRPTEDGYARYEGEIPCDNSGHFGFAVRILPNHNDLISPLELGLVAWES